MPLFRLLPVLLLFILLPGASSALEWEGTVLRVLDGDTVEVQGAGKVRLLGVDTPERKHSKRDRFFERWNIPPGELRHHAREARKFVQRTAEGRRVRLALESPRPDRYGRTLAYVYLPDGRLLNRLLIDEGHAVVYRKYPFALKGEFLAAEERAQALGRGLWRATLFRGAPSPSSASRRPSDGGAGARRHRAAP